MGLGVWDHSTQLQFVTFKIFAYKISEQKKIKKKKNPISSEKKITETSLQKSLDAYHYPIKV